MLYYNVKLNELKGRIRLLMKMQLEVGRDRKEK